MTKKQLNKEYAKAMSQADNAIGRKEAIGFFRRAEEIRKRLYEKNESSCLEKST